MELPAYRVVIMPYGVHERLRSHRGVDLTGKPRDLAFAYYQYNRKFEELSRRRILMVMILAAGRSKLLPQASGQGRKTVAVGQRVNFLPCLAHRTILDKAGHISGDILR